MVIGDKTFHGYTYVMAIINLTPDSFFANSRANSDDLLFRVEKAVKDGAAVIDIGAQSTRPGYTEISADEEIARFGRAVYEIKRRFEIPVSVDTYYEKSARVALELGADMINDVWGLSRGDGMAETIAEKGASVCIMHNAPAQLKGDVFPPVLSFLSEALKKAEAVGISADRICVDGGIGFAKSRESNWQLMSEYERLHSLGFPLLIGTSRKSLFGGDIEDRLAPTLASTRLAVRKGVLFVRVHDVKENVEAVKEEYDDGNGI